MITDDEGRTYGTYAELKLSYSAESYHPDSALSEEEFARLINKVKAEAWEEGARFGADLVADDIGYWDNLRTFPEEAPANPYRSTK